MNNMIETGKKYLNAGPELKRQLINYYNENCFQLVKPTRRYKMNFNDEWCAMFLSVIAHKSGMKTGQFPFEVSVFYMCELAKEWGVYSTETGAVSVGDLIIYDWLNDGTYDHVGIVSEVGDTHLTVLEGNYKNTVAYRLVSRSSDSLKGFIALGARVVPSDLERLNKLTRLVLKGSLGNGPDRQKALGSDFETVQKMVNKILK